MSEVNRTDRAATSRQMIDISDGGSTQCYRNYRPAAASEKCSPRAL